MYFIILSTASALFGTGPPGIDTAADAARALEPVAGHAASVLFALGIIGVGFLAVPVMTTGAAYDLAQSLGWRTSLRAAPARAAKFYGIIVGATAVAVAVNFAGFNPMRVLVWSGIVQGLSTPPLMLLILLMTNDRRIVGDRVNGRAINVLGWITTIAIFSASAALVVSWIV